jgi:hypothetical protein
MASGNYCVSDGSLSSVSEVIKLVVVELRELSVRRERVKTRIRSLHRTVDALEKFANRPPGNSIVEVNSPASSDIHRADAH